MSLVWQQQATLAAFTDVEKTTATITAAELDPITPGINATTASSITVDWTESEPTKKWATPQYRLSWSATRADPAASLYNGTELHYQHKASTTANPSEKSLDFTAVAAGYQHACGISRGDVYCWGASTNGWALGSSSSPVRTPRKVPGLPGAATTVSAGKDFSCAVVGGEAYCWGTGDSGRLGNGTEPRSTPKVVSGLGGKTVTSLSAGESHACVVADARAYCWGSDSRGQLGDDAALVNKSSAVAATGALSGRKVASVSAGGGHTCAVADGRAFCWGADVGKRQVRSVRRWGDRHGGCTSGSSELKQTRRTGGRKSRVGHNEWQIEVSQQSSSWWSRFVIVSSATDSSAVRIRLLGS